MTDFLKTKDTFNLSGSTVQNLRNGVIFVLCTEITHFNIRLKRSSPYKIKVELKKGLKKN